MRKSGKGKMGDLLRSRSMKLIHLVIPFDVAHDTVDELGHLGVVQFRDVYFPSFWLCVFLTVINILPSR